MKKVFILLIIATATVLLSQSPLQTRIEKYAGENSEGLLQILSETDKDSNLYFLLENASPNDLAVITPEFLKENVDLALTARQFPFTSEYNDKIFQHFVLPYRISQEPLQKWRSRFYEDLKTLVEDVDDIEKAAILVNLWVTEQMSFKPTHGRDQAPLTTIKRGYGRCEEQMIIYIAAARAVGIPARPTSTPYWSFMNNNHAWVEFWTPEGWKYLGEAENSPNRAWFSNTTKRAVLITSRIQGNYESKNTIKQENNSTILSSIENYTESVICNFKVLDTTQKEVENATIHLYAASWGGMFPMASFQTDQNGTASFPLGKGTVFITAHKDSLIAGEALCTIDSSSIVLNLQEKLSDINFDMKFLLPDNKPNPYENVEILGEEFYLRRKNRKLAHKVRLYENQNIVPFIEFYEKYFGKNKDDNYYKRQSEFLEKCKELANNTDDFIIALRKASHPHIILHMIQQWDIKDLIEIPDSSKIKETADIFWNAKQRFAEQIPDSIFVNHVIGHTRKQTDPPQNGWQQQFYNKISTLATSQLTETKENVVNWVKNNTYIDDDWYRNYFSGCLNPLQILNMKNIPEAYQNRLIDNCLKILGVPTRWQGRLEFFDGNDFIPVLTEKQKEEGNKRQLRISIMVDGKKIKATPLENFLLCNQADESAINRTFMEGDNDGLDFVASYLHKPNTAYYLEGMVRNANGDANISLTNVKDENHITLKLITPKIYLDKKWQPQQIAELLNFNSILDNSKYYFYFISDGSGRETDIRILEQINKSKDKFRNNKTILIQAAPQKTGYESTFDVTTEKQLIEVTSENQNYPILFLLNNENEVIFSSKDFNLGAVNYILKLIK
ncbi:MAG: transglutaminase-like domain-containing protein [Candidatus Cloacimonadota bacterium]|nr:transglutaminase-like domain-containing protein [Candidatus Cloacimonadota bacterium]